MSLRYSRGGYYIRFDLTFGYHHVDVHEEHQTYLGFHWYKDGVEHFYKFTVLPFGLSPASYVFTKVLRPLTKKWRGQGLKAIIFLDDDIASHGSKPMTEKAADIIQGNLIAAGFTINYKKSCFSPTQRGEWMGTIIDTTKLTIEVPKQKIPT